MLFILGFFLALTLQNAGIFGVELRYVHHSSMSTNIKTNPTEMLKRADKAENHGDYDTAIQIYRQLTPIFEKTVGPQHQNTLHVLNRLYLVYNTAKKYSQALSPAWQLYKIAKKLYGEEDERTIEFLTRLGKIYFRIGRHEKAEQLLKRAYRLNKSKLGQNHKTTIVNLFLLAHVYRESPDPEKWDLALRYYQKVYDVTSKDPKMSQGPQLALDALRHVGHTLSRQDKFKETAQVFQKVLAISLKTLGEDHPITQDARKFLVHALSGDGKIGQANEILRSVDSGKDKDEESFYTLFRAKSDALEKEGKYSKAIEILAEFYEHEMLKPQVSAQIFAILHKLIRYSRQQGDLEQILKWANAAIDLVDLQNQGQKVMVKVTTAEDRRDMILIRLHAIDSFIYVYAAQNDEKKVDKWFEIAKSSVEVIKSQGQGEKGQESIDQAVLDKFLTTVFDVARFKEKIGKTEEALTMYLKVARTPHEGTVPLAAVTALIIISVKKEDYMTLNNIAREFLQHSQSEPEETEEKLMWRESVTSQLAKKAKEEFELGNFQSAFSLLKIVETIWPKTWEEDFLIHSTFLERIAMAALKSKKFNEGFFYLDKAINLYKEKLASDSEMDDEEREGIAEELENLIQVKEKATKQFSKKVRFDESGPNFEKSEL